MLTLLSGSAFWHWMAFGFSLIFTEIFFPMALLFLWPGIAALMMGVVILFVPQLMPIYQIGIWLIISYIFTIEWIKYCRINPLHPVMYRPTGLQGQEYIGRQFELTKPIINGRGEIEIDEKKLTLLSIDDYPVGTLVKIARVEGAALRIQQIL